MNLMHLKNCGLFFLLACAISPLSVEAFTFTSCKGTSTSLCQFQTDVSDYGNFLTDYNKNLNNYNLICGNVTVYMGTNPSCSTTPATTYQTAFVNDFNSMKAIADKYGAWASSPASTYTNMQGIYLTALSYKAANNCGC